MKTISPAALQTRLAAEPGLTLLDVRTPVEFAEVHVPQAVNEPLGDLDPAKLSVAKDRPVYLICLSGRRAETAAQKLEKGGFREPVVVEGGTEAWVAASLPVERGAVKVISLERQVRIAAGSLVFIGVVLGTFVTPWFYALAGFVGAGLVFAGITGFCGMGLLLAKMPWNSHRSA